MRISSATLAGVLLLLFATSPYRTAAQERPTGPPADKEKPPPFSIYQALIERGGLLLRPGQLEVEPSVDYATFSSRRINVSGFSILPTLIIGVLETQKVQRTIVDPALNLRLGVFERFQVDARAPYRFIGDVISTETRETRLSNSGLGDVEGGFSYQPIVEAGWIPDIIVALRGKARTGEDPFGGTEERLPLGTGFYSAAGSVTAVKSSDPAVLFASVSYTRNFGRTVRILAADPFKTKVDPGDALGLNLGVGLALNNELALNFRLEQRFVFSSETQSLEPGSRTRVVPGSEFKLAVAFLGVTWSLTRRVSMDFSAGLGLTRDSPDVVLRLAFPIRAELW